VHGEYVFLKEHEALGREAGVQHTAVIRNGQMLGCSPLRNGRQAGGGQKLAPDAVIDDGLLDVVFLRPFPVASAPQVAAEVMGLAPPGQFVVRLRVPWIEVEARDPLPLNLDGEPFRAAHVRFAAEPRCLRVVLPPGCPCLSQPDR
jgi:diacylglycerol kinase family enzyme